MPLYSFQCQKGHQFDELRFITDRNAPAPCSTCGTNSDRILTTPVIHGFEEYYDENLCQEGSGEGTVVTSRGHREKRRKELGLVASEPTGKVKDIKEWNRRKPITTMGKKYRGTSQVSYPTWMSGGTTNGK